MWSRGPRVAMHQITAESRSKINGRRFFWPATSLVESEDFCCVPAHRTGGSRAAS